MTPLSNKQESGYAKVIYQLLSGVEEPEKAVKRARVSWEALKQRSSRFRSMLRAAGAFAKDNDGYFIRYERDGEAEEPKPLPEATHLFVFPVPVEPRMKVAYSYVQGIFLKYLYTKHQAIPREVRQGWAEVICAEDEPLPEADALWAEFLKSGVAEDAISVSAKGWTSGSNMGRRKVAEDFLSEAYLSGMSKAITQSCTRFQVQTYTIPAYLKLDISDELRVRDELKMTGDTVVSKFRSENRYREWNTLRVYKWLEAKAKDLQSFEDLVAETCSAIREENGKEISLKPVVQELDAIFRSEFVPLVSKQEYTEMAIPDIVRHLVLWELVEHITVPEDKKMTFLGWDIEFLNRMKSSLDSPELRGSLKFIDKSELPKRGTKLLASFTGFDKLKSEVRLVPQNTTVSIFAPYSLWDLRTRDHTLPTVKSGRRVCTVCGKEGSLSEAGILPENKKVHYDNPGPATKTAKVCARCVQVWSLAPISTADDSYAIVEVPVENFLELFALYESLEGISRLETLKTLNRVSSLSVFPNKYLLLSRSTGKGKMPQTAQYYLQLARQSHFMEQMREVGGQRVEPREEDDIGSHFVEQMREVGGDLEVLAAQDRARLSPEISLTMSVIRRLPYYHTTGNDEKVPAMNIINALDRGRPYEALYVAASQAHEAGRREDQAISRGVKGYDDKVIAFGEFFCSRSSVERSKTVALASPALQENIRRT